MYVYRVRLKDAFVCGLPPHQLPGLLTAVRQAVEGSGGRELCRHDPLDWCTVLPPFPWGPPHAVDKDAACKGLCDWDPLERHWLPLCLVHIGYINRKVSWARNFQKLFRDIFVGVNSWRFFSCSSFGDVIHMFVSGAAPKCTMYGCQVH
jgi:hypothetical protein